MSRKNLVHAGNGRVWTIEGGVGPSRAPAYLGRASIGNSSYNFGESTKVEEPDPKTYDKFESVDSIPGAKERPTMSIQARYSTDLSDFLRLARKGCRLDIHLHFGKCRDPQDFNGGWEKIRVYPDGKISTWSDDNASAMESGDNASTTEQIDLSAADIFELGWMEYGSVAATQATREIVDVVVCDLASCGGDCGDPSEGYNKVFALMKPLGSSAGASPRVIFSDDAFATADWDDISSLVYTDTATAILCIGSYIVVLSDSANGLEYTTRALLLAGTPSWVEVLTGFVAAKTPNDGVTIDARHTWICGNGGYIYFTADPTTGVSVVDAGSLTVQNLNKIDAYDDENVVAVGAANAVVYTLDGTNWIAVTGPSPAVALTAVACMGRGIWMVGNASGGVYYTENYGATWTTIGLPIAITAIKDIAFVDETEGFLTGTMSSHGYIFRTVSGGNSWYACPERVGAAVPTVDAFNSLAVAKGVHNWVLAGGLADNGSAGIIVKGA